MRVCSSGGCPKLVRKAGRCAACRREHESARGTRQARGYDAAYDNERRHYQKRMDNGESFDCWRCLLPVSPTDWTLGHCDDHRDLIHGPEHGACNYATSGRTQCPNTYHM